LNFAQQQELWLGVCRNSSAFENEAHARVAWARHKGRIMELWGRNGRRPVAWWHFEKGLRHPGIEHERSILFEFPEFADVLSADERAELEAYWRKEFERSWGPNFSFDADGRIYSGDAARWQHWLFVDLPPPLLDQLMAERERRGRVIDELEEASQQEEAVAETNSSPENERCGPPPIRG
jgi:hypothetical protein